MKIVCTSDTHGMHEQMEIPDGDILIHAGDISESSRPEDYIQFNDYLGTLPYPHKIVLSGNHDLLYELKYDNLAQLLSNAVYLKHGELRIENLKIWGSSWQPPLFGYQWSQIPKNIDLLITHIPPYGILDSTSFGRHLGSKQLLNRIQEVTPKIHVFGHVHESYGKEKQVISGKEVIFMNCTAIKGFGKKMNSVFVLEL